MARGNLATTQIARAGVAPPSETNGDATNGHTMVNDGKAFVLVRNSGAGARIVTFTVPGSIDGQSVTPRAVSLAAGVSRYFGPFPVTQYGKAVLIDVAHAELKLSGFHL